jgi:alanine racemase
MLEIASRAQANQHVSWLCIAGINEALLLRKKGITKPLLVLSYLDGSLEEGISQGIHFVASSWEDALVIASTAQKIGKTAFIHVKIDTGMGRLGIFADQVVQLIHDMTKLSHLVVYGVFTHLSHTGHADQAYSYEQLSRFDHILDDLKASGITIECTHALSSSSLHLKPKRKYSFMRVGGAAFGLWKNSHQIEVVKEVAPEFSLTPILEWRTRCFQLKHLPTGSVVGYQLSFITKKPSVIALVPIGYWDGYPHALSNKGKAMIKGYIVPVAGIVSMNLAAFDVTDVPDVQVGDEFILIGNVPHLMPYEVAHAAGQITNVLMTCINGSIERTIIEQHYPLVHPKGDEQVLATPSK